MSMDWEEEIRDSAENAKQQKNAVLCDSTHNKEVFYEKKTSPYPTAAGNDILFLIEYAIENNEIILHWGVWNIYKKTIIH